MFRRDFIKGTILLSTGTFFFDQKYFKLCDVIDKSSTSDPLYLRYPTQTGVCSSIVLNQLWKYYEFLKGYWELTSFSSITDVITFSRILDEKTKNKPSYLAEYNCAASLLSKNVSNNVAEYKDLAFINPEVYMREFVTKEFCNLLIATGGFKKFGYLNYSGFVGGRFDNPTDIPYRVNLSQYE